MKKPRRQILFKLFAVASAVLCVVSIVLWARGSTTGDELVYARLAVNPQPKQGSISADGVFSGTALKITTFQGRMRIIAWQNAGHVWIDSGGLANGYMRDQLAVAAGKDGRLQHWPISSGDPIEPQFRCNLSIAQRDGVTDRSIDLGAPHWFFVLIFLIPPLWAIRGKRSAAQGCCPACGYDLRATPVQCPECGHIPGAGYSAVK